MKVKSASPTSSIRSVCVSVFVSVFVSVCASVCASVCVSVCASMVFVSGVCWWFERLWCHFRGIFDSFISFGPLFELFKPYL